MRKLVLSVVLVGVLSLSFVAVAAQSTQVDVTPGDMQGWVFAVESGTGTGALVNGPDTPPIGAGSANLTVPNGAGGVVLAVAAFQGTPLADMTNLEYSTYRASGGPALAIALQFNIDFDLADGVDTFQGRMVYEPYHSGTPVLTGVWQTWNPQDNAPLGNWWFNRAPGNSVCPQSNPCTWQEVLTAFPNAGIHADLGAVILKAGSGWSTGFDGNVDALTIGVNGMDTTYNFEAAPTDKDQCKNGGWAAFSDPSFMNQGQCIKFVNTGK
ncbi:MAG: hypothetical protein H0V47_08655 [Chloroflexia bacterium]|nr:hypothetical protein [Chloroflexia bacterium]